MRKTSFMTILVLVLLLAACAHSPTTGIEAAMHAENNVQVGWREQPADDGDPVFAVQSAGGVDFAALLTVAEEHAKARCIDGYRVMSITGSDEPQVDSLNPRFILDSVVRLKVHCYEKESDSN
ncbi:MAG TPA: hypothetical protein VKT74_05735 [Gammaproteobacteria bacterium]|nr:hypothetical protein [Gammaproteobacteria bacterium]